MPNGLHTTTALEPYAGGFERHDRPDGVAFVGSGQAEAALHDGLAEWLPEMEIRRGGVRAAIAAQRSAPSPRVLIVDVSGEEPLAALGELSAVVEPETCVLVIGETSDLTLYREITRGMGAAEYLPGPLTRDMVRQHFGPFVRGQGPEPDRGGGGRLVAVTGARGGVGASVIAVSLACHLGEMRRHTCLLDADLVRGTAALMLDTDAGEGLRAALLAPDRIDALLAERVARPVADRVHVLAATEGSGAVADCAPGACDSLVGALQRRYNAVVADVPLNADPFCRDLLAAAHHRVVVMTPTLPGVRDALRLVAMPSRGGAQVPVTLVLNRATMPGALKRSQLEGALRIPVDVAIPDLPREISEAVTLGRAAKASSFRTAIAAIANQIPALRPANEASSPAARRCLRFLRWR
jgi:pilus assembly protein CpaE